MDKDYIQFLIEKSKLDIYLEIAEKYPTQRKNAIYNYNLGIKNLKKKYPQYTEEYTQLSLDL